jgi:DNA-binding winged helix-turn-helix (wHTH) protein
LPIRRFVLGDREVDLDQGEVRSPSGPVPLTPNEVKVLAVLAEREGQVVERDELLCAALGYSKAVSSRAIDQAVWRLRRKLEPEPHHPRWLLSETNVGYRLMLHPVAAAAPVGRQRELARLEALLAEHATVVIAGLPGSGRHALAEAAAASRGMSLEWRESSAEGHTAQLRRPDGTARTLLVTEQMPVGQERATVRVGALGEEEGRSFLISAVLAARGAARMSEEEELEAKQAAHRAGHHPGTLRAVAAASVLTRLGKVERWTPDARHIALLGRLPPEVHEALARCAVFPDPFVPSETGLAPELLERTWRACVLDAVEGRDGDRLFVVPPCLRALLTPLPEAASQAFVAALVEELEPLAVAALDGLDIDRMEAVARRGVRMDAALQPSLGARPEQARRLLPALLVRYQVTGELPRPLPTAPAGQGPEPDLDVCAQLLQAYALEPTDVRAALQQALQASALPASPVFASAALRAAFRLSMQAESDGPALTPLVEAMARLVERDRRPVVLASYRHLRGLYLLRVGSADSARGDLVAALGLYGERSAASRLVVSNLAAEAARDGRALEALSWSERVAVAELPAAEEARERLRRSSILAVAGDLAASERELAMAEMLGASERSLHLNRAVLALLRGEPERAVVLAEVAMARRWNVGDGSIALTMVLGWARLAQGLPELALAAVDSSTAPLSHADYGAQLALLRAAALARSGRPDEAMALLDATEPPTARWWSLTRRIVEALVRASAGAAVDPTALGQELDRGGFAHLVARFALVVLQLG